nr:hypothetical protein [Tanacetum cinerariifolium]
MRTRSSSNLVGESSSNPTTSNLKHHNRRRSKQPFSLEESPLETMADQCTMAELLRAPAEGYAEAIVVPPIFAEHFELKHSLINMMTSDQFFRLDKDNPHDQIHLLCACPHHGFTELHQLDTFYSDLNPVDQDSLNSAAGGNLLEKRTQDVLTIIENKSKVRSSHNKSIFSQVKSSDVNSSSSSMIAKLTHAVNQQTSAVTTATTAILKKIQAAPPPASVKAIEKICVTCGDAHPYYQCLAADGNTFLEFRDNIQGYILAVTVNYNQGNSSYCPPSVANQIRPSSFAQPNLKNNQNRFSQPQGYNRGNNFNQDISQALIQQNQVVPFSELEKIKKINEVNIKAMQAQINNVKNELRNEMKTSIQASMSNQTNELKNMMASFFQMNTTSTSGSGPLPSNTIANPKAVILKKLPEKLRDPRKSLIPYGFSELKCKALADLGASINLLPLSVWKKLGLPELISTRMTLKLANRTICTPARIKRDVFVSIRKLTFPAYFVIIDNESDPRVPLILGRPFLRTARALIDVYREEMILCDGEERLTLNMRHDTSSYSNQPHKESINMINIYNDSYEDYLEDLFATNCLSGNPTFSSHTDLTSPKVINLLSGNTTSSSPDHFLEEFADELALITFPPGNNDLPFDIESDLREIGYLLNHDPTKEMDSILEDSVDECNLADPNNDLVDTIPEMFTDEHTLDYHLHHYMMMSMMILLNLSPIMMISSNFLSSPEYYLVLYEDFSEVDDLPSTNNEDKVFNPGILIHENLFKVTIRVTPDKNVKKIYISNASLILEDLNPPLYELLKDM